MHIYLGFVQAISIFKYVENRKKMASKKGLSLCLFIIFYFIVVQ